MGGIATSGTLPDVSCVVGTVLGLKLIFLRGSATLQSIGVPGAFNKSSKGLVPCAALPAECGPFDEPFSKSISGSCIIWCN